MNTFVRDILNGVAEILPAAMQKELPPEGSLPVYAPNFPNDLDPVIRAEPDGATQRQGNDEQQGFDAEP
jgi:hypothetical protein